MDTSKQQSENKVVYANGKFAKGSKNRLTVKEVILGELEQLGPEHLHRWALEHPGTSIA